MKLTITPDKIAAANAPQTRLTMSIDITGLSHEQIAEALFNLATRVEHEADVEKRVAALRAKVEKVDASFATTTRLPVRHPDTFPVEYGDRELGRANVITITPTPKRTRVSPFALFDTSDEDEDEEHEEEAPETYDEDDDVEFWRHDQWHEGIVIDRTNLHTYLVEDKYGRRWEVNLRGLRKPDLDW